MFKSSVRNTVVWQFAKNLTDFISSISGQPHQQSLPALPNCAGCSQTRRSGCSWCRLRGVSPLPSPPLAGHHLPAKIYLRFISDRAAPRAPPSASCLQTSRVERTAIRNASAEVTRAGWGGCELQRGGGPARSSVVGPVSGRAKRRGLSSRSFPVAPSNRASLPPLQKVVALLFPTQHPKTGSQKAAQPKTNPLVISRRFRTPGSLHTFLLIAVTDYLKGTNGSKH